MGDRAAGHVDGGVLDLLRAARRYAVRRRALPAVRIVRAGAVDLFFRGARERNAVARRAPARSLEGVLSARAVAVRLSVRAALRSGRPAPDRPSWDDCR